ncbi:MAG TPA: PH domain-containing protein [Flavobacterium sp.]
MNEHIKSFMNEEQDPKAVEKITGKLNDLLMRNEIIGYIGVQKKPAINVFPDSIVLTNKRIIICKPKNLGLSMDFIDYSWEDIAASFVKENILGSEFSFSTKSDITISMDYLPKTQARKIFTFAKEQIESAKIGNSFQSAEVLHETKPGVFSANVETIQEAEIVEAEVEEVETEEVTNLAEVLPVAFSGYRDEKQHPDPDIDSELANPTSSSLANLSNEALFEKLQNYKKLLDSGLITPNEYDTFKKEILSLM